MTNYEPNQKQLDERMEQLLKEKKFAVMHQILEDYRHTYFNYNYYSRKRTEYMNKEKKHRSPGW